MTRQDSGPLEIDADETLEWWRDSQSYVATGNARARRGDITLYAQKLQAFYRDAPDGTSEVHRIEATGEVSIVSPTERAQGDFGTYDVLTGRLELTGNDLRLETQTDVVRARDSLVYDELKLQAIATGNASAVRADRRIHAGILTAELVDRGGNLEIKRILARQNVCVQSAKTVARGTDGVYNAVAGTAVLRHRVRIVQQGSVLTGDIADVNLNTGISRLRAANPTQHAQTGRRSAAGGRIRIEIPMDGPPEGQTGIAPRREPATLPADMRRCP